MPSSPRVSVVIPVYNGERFIAEAIQSIRRQALDSLEIIVVDDGSTDATKRIVEREWPDCRYLVTDRAGPAAARNAGVLAARGELVGFLDADDVFAKRGLASLHAALGGAGQSDIAMGMVRVLKKPAGALDFAPSGEPVICYNVGSVLVRRAVFDKVGLFDAAYRHCEDVDWFMRAQELGVAFEIVRDVVLFYRRHDTNMSLDHAATGAYLAKVLKASLDRRRELPAGAARSLDEVYYVRPGRLRV